MKEEETKMDGLRALDLLPYLQDRLITMPGGRDRRGGTILYIPSTTKRDRFKLDDYRKLFSYLITISSNETIQLGYTILIDMRGNGNITGTIKPLLKLFQENFSNHIHQIIIIKTDNFWQKQRTTISASKYKFETVIICIESIQKLIDITQLTTDLGGQLQYDNNQWIEVRLLIEEFSWQISDVLDRIDDLQEDIMRNEYADDVNGAKLESEHHNDMRKKILKLPIDELEIQGKEIFIKINNDLNLTDELQSITQQSSQSSSLASGSNSIVGNNLTQTTTTTKWYINKIIQQMVLKNNTDMSFILKQLIKQLEQVHNAQQQLFTMWQQKKIKLDQCFQLRLFEQDCEKMFDWILHNRDIFHMSYVEIGHNYQLAKNLQENHQKFTMASMNVCVNINRILAVAGRLIESNHYASQHIKTVANRLDRTWKEFASGLDERTTVLLLSVGFHHKAEQYCESVSSWAAACEASQSLLSDVQSLEAAIRTHQSVYEAMCQAYTEVHSTSKKLLYQLDHLVQVCNQPSPPELIDIRKNDNLLRKIEEGNPAADYSEGASHVLAVIHQILKHHRALENKWHAGKIKLHQRLALKLFQEDVKQVLDWLENHGEVFLQKNTGIGRNLQKARVYQKSHEHFEKVAQNTYSNAEKLLSAADELARSGEVAPNEIYNVAQELERHIASFAERVDQRRVRLEVVVSLYSHEKEVCAWTDRCRAEITSDDTLLSQESLDGTEQLVHDCQNQKEAALELCLKTIEQGESLLQNIR